MKTEFTVHENQGFRLRVEKIKCMRPEDFYSLNFVQESLKDGKVDHTSTYNFFLTKDQIKRLAEELVK